MICDGVLVWFEWIVFGGKLLVLEKWRGIVIFVYGKLLLFFWWGDLIMFGLGIDCMGDGVKMEVLLNGL